MKVVIPARYASSRLPGKPLADIAGKPMVIHVWERAVEALGRADDVFIAADDERILDAARLYGANAVITRSDHVSGTDRIAELVVKKDWPDSETIINVQGDEPLVPPALITEVGELLEHDTTADIATAVCAIKDIEEVENPNIVKAIVDNSGRALYFSRAPIPYDRDGATHKKPFKFSSKDAPYVRHIGLYAYKARALRDWINLPPAPMELLESLEQLRALHNGMKIMVYKMMDMPPAGVDTPADLEAVRALVARQSAAKGEC